MLFENLKILNLKAGCLINSDQTAEVLLIRTCQRTIAVAVSEKIYELQDENKSSDYLEGCDAYKFLLETICGLKSKMLGEYDIVSQFKKEFLAFLSVKNRDTRLIKIIEKLLKDAKEVRTKYLQGICQLSYSGISRKILLNHCQQHTIRQKIVITGTGHLCEELIKLLFKKFDLIIVGRNQKRLDFLKNTYKISTLEFSKVNELVINPYIINTIGANLEIFAEEFFNKWKTLHQRNFKVFIDLGSPSIVNTRLTTSDSVYRLDDIFAETAKLSSDKTDKITRAYSHIKILISQKQLNIKSNNHLAAAMEICLV